MCILIYMYICLDIYNYIYYINSIYPLFSRPHRIFFRNYYTHMDFFFTKYVLQYCLICCWINLQMQNHIYSGLAVKLYLDIQLCERWASLTPTLFKSQLYIVYAYTYTPIYPYTYGCTIDSPYSW